MPLNSWNAQARKAAGAFFSHTITKAAAFLAGFLMLTAATVGERAVDTTVARSAPYLELKARVDAHDSAIMEQKAFQEVVKAFIAAAAEADTGLASALDRRKATRDAINEQKDKMNDWIEGLKP